MALGRRASPRRIASANLPVNLDAFPKTEVRYSLVVCLLAIAILKHLRQLATITEFMVELYCGNLNVSYFYELLKSDRTNKS